MGAPYQSKSATGYNSSPPADDGSTVAANKITWAGIKSKLTDPTKTLSDAINSALRSALSVTPSTTSSTYATVVGDHLTTIEVTGSTAISLGSAVTMVADSVGYTVTVYNKGTGTVTVGLATATDTLSGQVNGTVTLPPGAAMTFTVAQSGVGYDIVSATGFAPFVLTGAAGTNTVTANAPANLIALYSGLIVVLTPAATNTGAMTLNITPSGGSALTAKNVFNAGSACAGGEVKASVPAVFQYDGTQFNILSNGLNGSAASTQNLVTNPNWQIDQINEGALYTVNAADVRGPDGWSGSAVGAGVFKVRTLADPDNAALKCLEITCTTADAAIAATDDYFLYSAIEGYNAAALQAGLASAQPIAIQFKFKTSVTGVYGISIANSALNRRYVGIITVSDTSEHEYVTTLTMDTSGTWLYTSGVGFYLRICLSAGSNFQATAGAWAAGAEQTTSAQCNFMSGTSNIAYLKRIQVVPGVTAMAYAIADINKDLEKAQRYYAKTFQQGTAVAQNSGSTAGALGSDFAYANGAGVIGVWCLPATMRAAPTVTTYNPQAADANWRRSDNGASTNQAVQTSGQQIIVIQGDTSTSIGFSYYIHATANARLS